jgi:hypothetical protein
MVLGSETWASARLFGTIVGFPLHYEETFREISGASGAGAWLPGERSTSRQGHEFYFDLPAIKGAKA